MASNYGFEFSNAPRDGAVNGDVFSFKMTERGVTGEMTVNGDEMTGLVVSVSETERKNRRRPGERLR